MHKTAQGRSLDMSSFVARNEKVRAIGNMNVNARGDLVNSHNQIIQDAQTRVSGRYRRSSENRVQAAPEVAPVKSVPVQETSNFEQVALDEFDDGFDEDQIASQKNNK